MNAKRRPRPEFLLFVPYIHPRSLSFNCSLVSLVFEKSILMREGPVEMVSPPPRIGICIKSNCRHFVGSHTRVRVPSNSGVVPALLGDANRLLGRRADVSHPSSCRRRSRGRMFECG